MFTGLIESTGTIVSVTPAANPAGPTRLTVSSPALAPRLRTGDSIAVSGVCLTALDLTLTQFTADLAQETVQRTTLSRLSPGAVVNLELPTLAGAPMGGHVVQGHVDGVGTLISFEPLDPTNEDKSDWRLRLHVPPQISKYVASQGSITVDGISLTVAEIVGDVVSIAVIPHTYAATALHTLLPGNPINIEVDILAKYAERQAQAQSQAANEAHGKAPGEVSRVRSQATQTIGAGWTMTEEYLLSNGY